MLIALKFSFWCNVLHPSDFAAFPHTIQTIQKLLGSGFGRQPIDHHYKMQGNNNIDHLSEKMATVLHAHLLWILILVSHWIQRGLMYERRVAPAPISMVCLLASQVNTRWVLRHGPGGFICSSPVGRLLGTGRLKRGWYGWGGEVFLQVRLHHRSGLCHGKEVQDNVNCEL